MRNVIKPTEYTFDASAKTVTLLTVGDPLAQEFILGIWNATRGAKLYDPHVPGYGGTVASTVLTLEVDTTTMADSDVLVIFYEDPTILASELMLGNIYAKLTGDPATDTSLQAILAKLIAGPATEATLAAILAKIIAAPATAANQASIITLLTTLVGKDFATQTTAAAILAKLTADPSTGAKQDTGNTALGSIITVLQDMLAEQRDDVFVEQLLWVDTAVNPAVYYREERIRSQDDGSITTLYTKLDDMTNPGSLPSTAVPVTTNDQRAIEHLRWRVSAHASPAVEYSANDWLVETVIIDAAGTGTVLSTFWYNATTGTNISAPSPGDIVSPDTEQLTAIASLLTTANGLVTASNVYLQAIQTDLNTLLGNFGAPANTSALTPTQNTTLMALFKLLGTNMSNTATSAGAIDTVLQGVSAAEDVASANGDKALRMLTAIRKAVPANTSNLDGDYEFLQMANGLLWVALGSALPAGTNAIGKLAANSGVDIGDVDVTSVPADPFGVNADAAVAAGATGSIQAKLRRMTQGLEDLKTLIVLAAGANVIGKVGIDQTTPDTTNAVSVIKLPKASSANTPSIITSTGDVSGLASNSSRKGWMIQNLGTNTLYVRMATGATTSIFHVALAPGAVADDGRGASYSDNTYTGVVSVAGTSPRFVATEL